MPPIITPYVPEYITVHLGPPASNAQNVTVSFPEYIKNVASSEIYPTWEESAIIANIYAQISFALNRVYLEFYPSQGYNFNITNTTAYDQSFQDGRNIFENINRIVDEIFNNYIRRVGFAEPLAAKFCNGTTTTCEGLSQWGSQNLAEQGYNSVQILRYYYGDNIELVQNAPVMGVRSSYPGTPLRVGSTGPNVFIIQTSLNRVSQDYPLIPKINPVTGIFDEATENAVRTFQGIFNLTQDGIVGKATWYKLVMLYVGITKLAELESEGQRYFGLPLEYPEALSEGDTGETIRYLQFMLSVLAEFYQSQPFLDITGTYDSQTKNAVLSFQRNNQLSETGVVDPTTWEEIYQQFRGIVDTVLLPNIATRIPAQAYPGVVLSAGLSGPSVTVLQQYLNIISLTYTAIVPFPVTGTFDEQTVQAVRQYQELFNLPVTGQVDETVWNSIINTYKDVVSATTTSPRQYPGYTLSMGSRDTM